MILFEPFDRYEYEVTDMAGFSQAGGAECQAPLVHLAERIIGTRYANNPCVRLDQIRCNDDGVVILFMSEGKFFDFVSSNLILCNMDRAFDEAVGTERDALEALVTAHRNADITTSIDDVLRYRYLSNALAVSCLITDKDGRCLLTRRNSRTGIGNGFISVSVTGSMEPSDLTSEDPLVTCCARECAEELAFGISPKSAKVSGIVCGVTKLQPAAVVTVHVDSIEMVTERIENAADFSDENDGYIICGRDELRMLLDNESAHMTEVGRTHLEMFASA